MPRILIFFIPLFIMFSCDFSTHEYWSYVKNKNSDKELRLSWMDDSSCFFIADDTTLLFDGIELIFPSDNSVVRDTGKESYYQYYDDPYDTTFLDSSLQWIYYLDLLETDKRISVNDSVHLNLFQGDKITQTETLYREKHVSRFIDRLPLWRMH